MIVEGRYRIEEELGAGAMGRVFAARHIKVGRRVAIKVMHAELAQNAAIVERFAREAQVAARLSHPNVVSVLDVGAMPDGRPLMVMDFAPGVPLSALETPMAPARVIDLVRQLLLGLDHAHGARLIHRDLKPDNVLVDEAGVARIVDFGIAVMVGGRRLTEANVVIGTPFYMSPEQARAKEVDHRTDLFSLGVIMYELLAGMTPFPGTTVDVALANTMREPPTIFERAGIEVDALLEAFARKLMARRREDRFASADDALRVLALIERDRIAAARVFAGSRLEEALPVVKLANTDALSTVTDGKVTRRPRWGFAVVAVAVAFAALVFTGGAAEAPRAQMMVTEAPSMRVRGTTHEDAPPLMSFEAPMKENATSRVLAASAPMPSSSGVDAWFPTVESKPAVLELPKRESAAEVVAKYIAVGKALKQTPNDEMWARYRLIRINAAIATADGRRQTMASLGTIEASLSR